MIRKILLTIILSVFLATTTYAATFSWLPNPETDLAGYKLYANNEVAASVGVDVGANGRVSTTVPDPTVVTEYYVTAYNTSGMESDPSSTLVFNPDKPASCQNFRVDINIGITIPLHVN